MKRKKKVYVESSVISYLTARDSTNDIKRGMQVATRKWWDIRSRFDLYTSTVVLSEIAFGDTKAAKLRLEVAAGIQTLKRTAEAVDLASQLIANNAVPAKATDDAAHIAIAAVHGMDLIVTWNHAHIANQDTLEKIREIIKHFGFAPPSLVDPNFILEGKHEN